MKVFHKSTCITCKRAISEIQRMKKDVETRDFFKEPLTEQELKKIIKLSGKKPKELLRKRDKMYKELKFESKQHTDNQIIKYMIKYPGLIQRPIIIMGNKILIGKISSKDIKS
ncbi:MAG: ArsC/Spx/MgsR family protein [Nitrosopumilaceae archaeon]|nr:ArsC/Spx/MgsR family protein [Nitrosopumilaceae archaeon]